MMRVHKHLSAAITLALIGAGAQAATITVNSNDDSATSTLCNLRNAVQSVNAGAATATCVSAVTGAFGSSDTIAFDPAIAGSTITLQQGELLVANPLVIDGTQQTIDAQVASRIFNVTSTLSASGLSLVNGHSTGAGGAAYVTGGTAQLSLTGVTVSGSAGASSFSGGVIGAFGGSTLNLTHSTITGNSSTAVVVSGSKATLTDTTVSNNTATCAGNYCAAGVVVWGGTAAAIRSTISGNHALGSTHAYVTGGFYAYNSTASLTNCTVSGNSAQGAEDIAGGVAETHAAVLYDNFNLTLTNTTVSANTATTTNPNASGVVGGILVGAYQKGTLTLANVIDAANNASGGASPQKDFAGKKELNLAFTYSLLGSALNVTPYNAVANNNVFSDAPGLAPLANNGGATQTMALLAGSPALSGGSLALAKYNATALNYDQRGVGYVRTLSGTVDIGAFESFRGDRLFADGLEPLP